MKYWLKKSVVYWNGNEIDIVFSFDRSGNSTVLLMTWSLMTSRYGSKMTCSWWPIDLMMMTILFCRYSVEMWYIRVQFKWLKWWRHFSMTDIHLLPILMQWWKYLFSMIFRYDGDGWYSILFWWYIDIQYRYFIWPEEVKHYSADDHWRRLVKNVMAWLTLIVAGCNVISVFIVSIDNDCVVM